jgi:hypothetical protein
MSTRTRERRPSPPWHGALFTAGLFGSVGWLLLYTLPPTSPVEALGAWNYVGAASCQLAAILAAALWRGDPGA